MKLNDFMGTMAATHLVAINLMGREVFTVRPAQYFRGDIYTYQKDYGDYFVVSFKALRENEIFVSINKEEKYW